MQDLIPGIKTSEMPEELKTVGLQVNAAMRRFRKASEQYKLWKEEIKVSELELHAAQERMNNLLPRWNINTGVIEPALEELKTPPQEESE